MALSVTSFIVLNHVSVPNVLGDWQLDLQQCQQFRPLQNHLNDHVTDISTKTKLTGFIEPNDVILEWFRDIDTIILRDKYIDAVNDVDHVIQIEGKQNGGITRIRFQKAGSVDCNDTSGHVMAVTPGTARVIYARNHHYGDENDKLLQSDNINFVLIAAFLLKSFTSNIHRPFKKIQQISNQPLCIMFFALSIIEGVGSVSIGTDLVYEATTIQSQKPWIVVVVTIFLCSVCLEVLERRCGMQPTIFIDAELKKRSESNYNIHRRLTKALDTKGQFRMQRRAAVFFIKGTVNFIGLVMTLGMWFRYPQWFRDHFIYFVAESVYFAPLFYSIAIIVGVYIFEILSDRYAKLGLPLLIHHWLTIFAALLMYLGVYNPFAYWYAFTLIAMHFPTPFMMGFRAQYSSKYPNFTRKGFTFCFYYLIFLLILNFSGQIVLIINWRLHHYYESVHFSMIITTAIACCFWFYDDVQVLKALKAFSTQNYEDIARADHESSNDQLVGMDTTGNECEMSTLKVTPVMG